MRNGKWMKWLLASVVAVMMTACGGGNTVIDAKKAVISFFDKEHGVEPWVTDGEVNGTKLLKDIHTGVESSDLSNAVEIDGKYYFMAFEPSLLKTSKTKGKTERAGKLWKTDGTTEGTVLVKDLFDEGSNNPRRTVERSEPRLIGMGGVLYILTGSTLWKSTGTADGTSKIKDDLSADTEEVVVSGEKIYFAASSASFGKELWSSDGTTEQTKIVKDINNEGDNSSSPRYLTDVDGVLYFSADDQVHGRELWKSDGTEENTVMVKDIYPDIVGLSARSNGPNGSYPKNLTNVNGVLYFSAHDAEFGKELHKSDGTPEGTVLVSNIATDNPDLRNFVLHNNLLYFTVKSPLPKHELWRSDGTETGTEMIKDIRDYAYGFVSLKEGLVFKTGAGNTDKLWASDGTEVGTKVIHTLDMPTAIDILHVVVKGSVLIYASEVDSFQLWKTDATAEGTIMLAESPVNAPG